MRKAAFILSVLEGRGWLGVRGKPFILFLAKMARRKKNPRHPPTFPPHHHFLQVVGSC